MVPVHSARCAKQLALPDEISVVIMDILERACKRRGEVNVQK